MSKEISLTDLMKEEAKRPEVVEVAAIQEAESKYTPEQEEEIEKIKASIDVRNSVDTLTYGSEAQKSITDFSSTILKEVQNKDAGEAGELLTDLLSTVKSVNVSESESFLDKLPIIGGIKNKIEKQVQKFETVEKQIKNIESKLMLTQNDLAKDINMLDDLYIQNLSYYQSLRVYLEAGARQVEEYRTVTIPKMQEELASLPDTEQHAGAQALKDFSDRVNQLEKRLTDLETSKTISIQSGPQIRLIQNNDVALMQKMTSAINDVLPLWRNQITICLANLRAQKVVEMGEKMDDYTEDLLRKNSEMLHDTSIRTAKYSNKSMVDPKVLKETNEQLIKTINDTLDIEKQGQEQRRESLKQLKEIQSELAVALQDAAARSNEIANQDLM